MQNKVQPMQNKFVQIKQMYNFVKHIGQLDKKNVRSFFSKCRPKKNEKESINETRS